MTEHLDEAAGSLLLATAAAFVAAQTGGPERLSALHHRQANGLCGGCLTTPTRWPCGAARIASAARDAVPLTWPARAVDAPDAQRRRPPRSRKGRSA